MNTFLRSGMDWLNPFDPFAGGAWRIKLRNRFSFAIPRGRPLFNDAFKFVERSRAEPKIIMMRGIEQAGLLRHQASQASQQYWHAASESLVSRERSGLGNDEVRCGHVSMNVFHKSERP